MGDFAVNVAVAYQIGAARGDYSILSAMDIRDDELFAALGREHQRLDPAASRGSGTKTRNQELQR